MRIFCILLFLVLLTSLAKSQTLVLNDTTSRLSKFYFRGHGFWMNINGNDELHRIIIYNDYFNVDDRIQDSTILILQPSVTSDLIYESNLKQIGDSLKNFIQRQKLYNNLLDFERVFRKAKSINRTDRMFYPIARV
jgi:hypothetical protein